MLDLISMLLLGYYLVMALVLLVFLVWGRMDHRRHTNRRPRRTQAAQAEEVLSGTVPGHEPGQQADPAQRTQDKVLKFRRNS